MFSKRSTTAARWGRYILAGALLAVLVASGISAQLFATSDTPHGSSLEDPDRTLYAHGHRLRPLVEETGGEKTLNIYGPGGQIIAQVAQDGSGGQEAHFLLADHLGSTRAILDADDNVVAHFEYGPHGETATSGVAAAEARYRYTGHPYDEAQGVYQTPARTYDPTTGRFLSVDPQRQDASPYVYAGNNPVGFVDPTGGGGVPFFVFTGFTEAGGKKSHVAHSISLQFGLDGADDQQMWSADAFKSGGEGVGSYAEKQSRTIMRGQATTDRNYTYNGKMYWIVGGEEEVDEMDRLKEGMAAFRTHNEDFPSEVTILNFSGDGARGTDLRDKLRALNLDPLVVDAEQHGLWKAVGRGKKWMLLGFTVDGKSDTPNNFVQYVHDLEEAHKEQGQRDKDYRQAWDEFVNWKPGGRESPAPPSNGASPMFNTVHSDPLDQQAMTELLLPEQPMITNLDPYDGD